MRIVYCKKKIMLPNTESAAFCRNHVGIKYDKLNIYIYISIYVYRYTYIAINSFI